MKIAMRHGHSINCRGAHKYIDEVDEAIKIYIKVIEYLKADGHEILDCSSEERTQREDLRYGVDKANRWGADFFCSIHLNAGGGYGCESLYISEKGKKHAQRISAKMAENGFTNRGAKYRDNLYELNHTNAVANIIEVCFVDSKSDVKLYHELGVDAIALKIAEGIVGDDIIVANINGWQLIDNQWCYIENNTRVKLKWIKTNNKWYWLKSNGIMAKSEILKLSDNKTYYFDETGAMYSNSTIKIGEDGAMENIERVK